MAQQDQVTDSQAEAVTRLLWFAAKNIKEMLECRHVGMAESEIIEIYKGEVKDELQRFVNAFKE